MKWKRQGFSSRIAAGFAALLAAGALHAQPSVALDVKGDIPAALHLTAEDLARMPHENVTAKQEDGSTVHYGGVRLREILTRAGAPAGKDLRGKSLATYVLAKARDGYEIVFTLAELDPRYGDQPILLANSREGQPLDDKQGPLRLICPRDTEGARSVRMLEELDIVSLRK